MRITILTVGTRGDVQPYLALGVKLQTYGHKVKLATVLDFAELAQSYGLEFAPVTVNVQELMQTEQGRSFVGSNRNPLAFVSEMKALLGGQMAQLFQEFTEACQDADLIIFSNTGIAGYSIAQKMGLPAIAAYSLPTTPTADFPMFIVSPLLKLGRAFNLFTYTVFNRVYWQIFGPPMNHWRQEYLHLPPLSKNGAIWEVNQSGLPILYGFSSFVVPKPADWADSVHITGYWFLEPPTNWQPPQELLDFLAAGPPPVYIGFGSMNHRHPERLVEIALAALAYTGQRGVLSTGWIGLQKDNLPKGVILAGEIPHSWLFPRVAAVVHHGGAGTTAAGLRAGVPSIIVPFFADQPFWGARVHALGVGPRPIPIKKLTANSLAAALREAANPAMQDRAAELGQQIQAEDGLQQALLIINDQQLNKIDQLI